jgi:hypothetical protein
MFELLDTTLGVYLHHRSELGEYWLSSDAVIPSVTREPRTSHIVNQVPKRVRLLTRSHADFFQLFCDFRGYVEFFLLQDLVTEDCSAVRFFSPFDDFRTSPLPGSVPEYMSYRQLAMSFIAARNRRISDSYNTHHGQG